MPSSDDRAGLALDACGLLNLAASGLSLSDIAEAFAQPLFAVEQVAAEALWVEDLADGDLVRVPIDLAGPAFAALTHVSLTEAEAALYVSLARDLDDGEAATIAMAQSRTLVVVTDDRKARRVALEQGVELAGTAQVLRRVLEHRGASPEDAAEVLRRVQRRAHFVPRRDDTEADWWRHVTVG